MIDGWFLAIPLLLVGLLLLVGFIASAQRWCDEKRRARGIEPDKARGIEPDNVSARHPASGSRRGAQQYTP
jgi:hypothetical protein